MLATLTRAAGIFFVFDMPFSKKTCFCHFCFLLLINKPVIKSIYIEFRLFIISAIQWRISLSTLRIWSVPDIERQWTDPVPLHAVARHALAKRTVPLPNVGC